MGGIARYIAYNLQAPDTALRKSYYESYHLSDSVGQLSGSYENHGRTAQIVWSPVQ